MTAVDAHPMRYTPEQREVERILTRRLIEKRLDGFTLESSLEILEALASAPAPASGGVDAVDKPCPFCGGTNTIQGGDDKVCGIFCKDCGAAGPNGYQSRLQWNDRASLSPAATSRSDEVIGALLAEKPFVFDPATNFAHADDGGAPEHGTLWAPVERVAQTSGSEAGGEAITARYTNWRGETAERTFIPHRVFFGSNEWHPEPQVLIEATDCEKGALRTFAAAGFALAKPASSAGGDVLELLRDLVATLHVRGKMMTVCHDDLWSLEKRAQAILSQSTSAGGN